MTTVFLWDYYKFLWKLRKPLSPNFPIQLESSKIHRKKIIEFQSRTLTLEVQHMSEFIKF